MNCQFCEGGPCESCPCETCDAGQVSIDKLPPWLRPRLTPAQIRIVDLERQVQQLAGALLDEQDDCAAAVRTIAAMLNGEVVQG